MLGLSKICALFLAVGAMTAMSIPVMADDSLDTDTTVSASEAEKYGNTTLSIFQARQDPKNVSFTVPLYVTMAVVEGEPEVVMPQNYAITNTSQPEHSGNSDPASAFSIAVVKMEFSKMADSSYNTVENESDLHKGGATGRDILFQIGNLTMPALSEPGTKPVNLRAQGSQFLASSSEADYATSKPKEIKPDADAPDNVLALDLKGTVPATLRLEDVPPATQFQVKYILSVLDGHGQPLGNVYAGDDRTVAGLPPIEPGD